MSMIEFLLAQALGICIGAAIFIVLKCSPARPRLYRIVKFQDGTYAIRWGFWPWYTWVDKEDNYYWHGNLRRNQYCLFDRLLDAQRRLREITDKGVIVE